MKNLPSELILRGGAAQTGGHQMTTKQQLEKASEITKEITGILATAEEMLNPEIMAAVYIFLEQTAFVNLTGFRIHHTEEAKLYALAAYQRAMSKRLRGTQSHVNP